MNKFVSMFVNYSNGRTDVPHVIGIYDTKDDANSAIHKNILEFIEEHNEDCGASLEDIERCYDICCEECGEGRVYSVDRVTL